MNEISFQLEGRIIEDLSLYLSTQVFADKSKVKADVPLKSIGMDSLAWMEVILFVERKYQISFPLEYLTPEVIDNLQTFSRCLAKIISARG